MPRLSLFALALALAACQSAAPPAPGGDADGGGPLSDASVYHVDATW